MAIVDALAERCKAMKEKKVIVLPEGQDYRVVIAANKAVEMGVVSKVIVLGSEEEIANACKEANITERKFESLDYLNSKLQEEFAASFTEMRKAKGMTLEKASEMMKNRIYFGSKMCRLGYADGLVAGSIASTGDMLKAAFHCIGTAPGMKIASGCFLMDLAFPTESGDTALIFADCAVNPNPNADQLVDIAFATCDTYRALVGKEPKVAFLSFSTKGSAEHELLDKVKEASAKFKAKVDAENLNIICDGELQADAALVPSVAKSKAPGSKLVGDANVLIFPDLNAGNISYKLVQRLAKAEAYGPILQGLSKPLNDLSRGCNADDIFGQILVTVCQANGGKE